MEIKVVNGRKLLVRHMFKVHEIDVGSTWAAADETDSTVEVVGINGDWLTYRHPDGKEFEKDWFSFQCRYCLVLDHKKEEKKMRMFVVTKEEKEIFTTIIEAADEETAKAIARTDEPSWQLDWTGTEITDIEEKR